MPEHFYYNATLNGNAIADLVDKDTITTDRLPYHYRLDCPANLDTVFAQIAWVIDSNTNTVRCDSDSYLDMSNTWADMKNSYPMISGATTADDTAGDGTAAEAMWRQALCRIITSTLGTATQIVDPLMESKICTIAEDDDLLGASSFGGSGEQSGTGLISGSVVSFDATSNEVVLMNVSGTPEVAMRVYGAGIQAGTTVSAYANATKTVTLDRAPSAGSNPSAGRILYFESETGVDASVATGTGVVSGNRTSTWGNVVDSVRYGDSRGGAAAGVGGSRGDLPIAKELASAFARQAWRSGRVDNAADTASAGSVSRTVATAQTAAGTSVVVNDATDINVQDIVGGPGINNTGNANDTSGADGQHTFVSAISGTTITLSTTTLSALPEGRELTFTPPGSRTDNFAFIGVGNDRDDSTHRSGGDRLNVTFKIKLEGASTQSYASIFTDGNMLQFQSNPTVDDDSPIACAAAELYVRIQLWHNAVQAKTTDTYTNPGTAVTANSADANVSGDSDLNNV